MKAEPKSVGKNCLIMAAVLIVMAGFCLLIKPYTESDSHVLLIGVLGVLFVSRLTDGYVYGILSSVIAVFGVNYIFTYPYFAFNFTITGYPLTFVAMLVVACSVSALTTQIKKQEQIRLEVEREKMRGNLLRAVSHDIRTPLTSIMGSASVIQENYGKLTDEKRLSLIGDIRDEAQWLIRIVENLLSITRIDGDKAKLDTQDELVEEIVSSAVIKFKKRFPEASISVDMPEELLLVPMDGILIEQVIVNLLENSMLHGKCTTEIRIVIRDQTDRVLIAVEDNGAGIRRSALPHLFEGSSQTQEGEESDSRRNMGIGLSVCMTIIKAHHGCMKAENRKSGGARVMFWLPKSEWRANGDQG